LGSLFLKEVIKMGMYSSLADEDIKVKDLDGLKAFLERWKKEFPDYWVFQEDMGMFVDGEFTFSFKGFNYSSGNEFSIVFNGFIDMSINFIKFFNCRL